MKLFWLMGAGALGTAARYGLTVGIQAWLAGRGSRTFVAQWLGGAFPLGTLVINVVGTLLLSVVVTLAAEKSIHPDLRLILGTGFLGAFTTFSAFELEAEGLLSQGAGTAAAFYILGNLLLGFIAIFAGRALALRLIG